MSKNKIYTILVCETVTYTQLINVEDTNERDAKLTAREKYFRKFATEQSPAFVTVETQSIERD